MFDCDVHGILFACIIPHSNFYYVVYFLGLFLLLGYDALTFFNLLWLLHPKVGNLESVLTSCQKDKSVDDHDGPRRKQLVQWSKKPYFVQKLEMRSIFIILCIFFDSRGWPFFQLFIKYLSGRFSFTIQQIFERIFLLWQNADIFHCWLIENEEFRLLL